MGGNASLFTEMKMKDKEKSLLETKEKQKYDLMR